MNETVKTWFELNKCAVFLDLNYLACYYLANSVLFVDN